ncbi:MAG: pseudouridine-5'-phosphate glycosidase [Deltaproteobacteria bacterium]|nr:pseudouridine-5'-phosphate glycosidase [Deltaproteobacteria bacterium]
MNLLAINEEVKAALDGGHPVVALESTIIAHGLPWPDNLEVARALEQEVRTAGAIPATIAVVGGIPRIGLGPETLEGLARHGQRFGKAGASDLAVAMARRLDAATTVSATAFLADRAGIRLFATGGIGGVHRGDTGDVSYDLAAMAKARVAVVSAGAKAILDLPRTVEMLETQGVLVLGYRTSEFPAFYSPRSGIPLEHRVDSPAEAAVVLRTRFFDLKQGGVLACNPIPSEAALDDGLIQAAIDQALHEAGERGVRGKALTPFLLAELARTTGGAAVVANRALALANARVAAEIARALCGMTPRS